VKHLKAFILISALLSASIGCAPGHSTHNDHVMSFHVDSSLLSALPYLSESSGIGIYPPAGWLSADSSHLFPQGINEQLYREMKAVFYSPETECMLLIQDFPLADTTLVKQITENPAAWYNADSTWTSVMSDTFTYKGFNIQQFVLQNPQLVVFKLFVLSQPGITELNYLVQPGVGPETMKSVESSIGSIYSLTN
jgi:hypothetical protein